MIDQVTKARNSYASLLKKHRQEKAEALSEWSNRSIVEIDAAKSISEIATAFARAPYGAPAKEKALEKWVQICSTPEEIAKAREASLGRFQAFWSQYGEPGFAVSKWIHLSNAVLAKVATVADINAVLSSFTYPRESRRLVIERALDRCATFKEVNDLGSQIRSDEFSNLIRYKHDVLYEKENGKPYPYMSLPL